MAGDLNSLGHGGCDGMGLEANQAGPEAPPNIRAPTYLLRHPAT